MIPIERLIDALASLLDNAPYRITTSVTGNATFTPRRLLAPDCLLPVLTRMAEETWKARAGQVSFGLAIEPDRNALCGQRLHAVHHAPLSLVILCTDQTLQRVADAQGVILLDALEHHANTLCAVPASQPMPV